MTNQKLGVLLVDVPEPRYERYYYIVDYQGEWDILYTNDISKVTRFAYRCTAEEAKKYPQFRWVALEELSKK
ncbi:TPA: hypothetical protein ACGPAP_000068 [Streptococcus suis]